MADFIKEKEMEIKVLNTNTQMSKRQDFSRQISELIEKKKAENVIRMAAEFGTQSPYFRTN